MKTMIMADFLTTKKYLLSQCALSALVGVIIAVSMQNLYILLPCIACMVPFYSAFSLLAFDERNNWQQFRLTLPLARKDVQVGRYLFLVLVTLGGIAIGALISGVVFLVAQLFPQIEQLAVMVADFDWLMGTGLLAAVSLAIMMLVFAIILPMVARMGMTKAVRFVPLIIVVAIPLFSILISKNLSAEVPMQFLLWLSSDQGIIIASLVLLCVTAVLYAISCALAIKLYEKREL